MFKDIFLWRYMVFAKNNDRKPEDVENIVNVSFSNYICESVC